MNPFVRGYPRRFLCGIAFVVLATGFLVGMGSGLNAQGLTLPIDAAALPLPTKKPAYTDLTLPAGFVPVAKPAFEQRVVLRDVKPMPIARSARGDKMVTPRSEVYKRALELLHEGKNQASYQLLRPVLDADGGAEPQHLNWLAGLATYRMGRVSLAENHFKASAALAGGDDWLKSGAYFWASRAALLDKNFGAAEAYLVKAASYNRTFYGLVALRALGQDMSFDWEGDEDPAYYPVTRWQPNDGWRIDPALLNAFIRQESRFTATAQNGRSKATGLMQIMPATAVSYLGGTKEQVIDKLRDPQTNITVGQWYIQHLIDETDGHLFDTIMSYNAGPYAVKGWAEDLAEIKVTDPLLYIELIPYAETRNFVERVVANYWVYQNRFGQHAHTLDAVASGEIPFYVYGGKYAEMAGR